ncbi:DedA family protein [Acidipropionibacterium timonense]|uniref:DedA family protein n=1 Tax=Acidipropionibacterium timonense TaxID=2161818 RepID=UPI00103244B9|nr:VTT domain-containing protein [Acidipropionibacterium timonense]
MTSLAILQTTLAPMLLPSWLDPATLIHGLGSWALVGVCAILFVECAIFPVLPGDSLLFTVGLLVAATPAVVTFGSLGAPWVYLIACLIMTVAAVLGNLTGYYVGQFIAPWLFKPRAGLIGRVFSQANLDKSHAFFERYGSKALVLGRFVPFVRTFVTMVAGASRMPMRRFLTWTALGGVAWVFSVTLMGYLLGNVPFIGSNVDLILVLIVAVTTLPIVIEYLRQRRRSRAGVLVDEAA